MWGKKKEKETTKRDKKIVTCDVGTAQCKDRTIKCEKKNKGTTKCERRIITYDVGIAECDDETVKCEK